MGRYPWTICTRAYLKDVEVYFDETTMKTMRRGLKIIGVALTELKKTGRATTTNPRRLVKQDIEAFLDWMKKREVKVKEMKRIGLRQATQANYMGYLQNLLRWVNNPVLEKMKVMNHVHFPQKVSVEIRAKSEDTVEKMRKALADMPGWEGCVARFMVAVYAYSGLRRSELRLARIQDVDTQGWTIFVAHPKGEGHYATPQVAPILPPAREEVLAFLKERRTYLESHGIAEAEALVPVVGADGRARYWTDGMWGKVKADAQEKCGVDFRIQELRATFAQMSLDIGNDIQDVSRALRHKTTKTTELYYARVRSDHAFRRLDEKWRKHLKSKSGQTSNNP